MNRRTLLRRTGVAATVAVAGCLSGNGSTPLEVADGSYGENEDGYFTYSVTVMNPTDGSRQGTIQLTGSINGDSFEKTREVELAAHATETYGIEFDVKYQTLRSFDAQVEMRSGT